MATETMNQPVQATGSMEHTRNCCHYRPNVDIVERAEELILYADVPGVRSEDLNINFEDGTLTIHGTVSPRQEENTHFLRREYGVGDFHRSFQISEIIDVERIHAEYSDGVLAVHLPKVEAVKPKKIEVKAR